MRAALLERVRAGENLPSLPMVAVEILRLVRNDNVTGDELAGVIQQDPAMTGRILKVVNSSLFGLSRQIASPKQAVNMLGLRTVKVMALSFSLVDAVRACQSEGAFDFEAYWRRSLTSAVAGRLLARPVVPHVAEESFVCGLLADLGMIAAWRCAPELYNPVLEAAQRTERRLDEIEVERLGLSHAELSAALLSAWGLPALICDAVAVHHQEGVAGLEPATAELARLTQCAALVAELFCCESEPSMLEQVKARCRDDLGIEAQALERVFDSLDAHVRQQAAVLALRVGETVDYARLQLDAASHLASLSMQAEVERLASTTQVAQTRAALQRANQQREAAIEAATVDGLTRLANRGAFDLRLVRDLDLARRQGLELGLILLDVDHFKRLNDTYGHRAGDAVLRAVGQCLAETVGDEGFVARYGGEEFIVLSHRLGRERFADLAERLRVAIARLSVQHDGQRLRVTTSLGVACVKPRSDAISPEQLLELADRGLYQAKRNGRNRVEIACEPAAPASR
ncbi:MAG TPA: GGDEF domain-containing protein [Phycisphaerae bacterium]|nr:GGDEF domain-containing protein [Phycisphaerae bacterium]